MLAARTWKHSNIQPASPPTPSAAAAACWVYSSLDMPAQSSSSSICLNSLLLSRVVFFIASAASGSKTSSVFSPAWNAPPCSASGHGAGSAQSTSLVRSTAALQGRQPGRKGAGRLHERTCISRSKRRLGRATPSKERLAMVCAAVQPATQARSRASGVSGRLRFRLYCPADLTYVKIGGFPG